MLLVHDLEYAFWYSYYYTYMTLPTSIKVTIIKVQCFFIIAARILLSFLGVWNHKHYLKSFLPNMFFWLLIHSQNFSVFSVFLLYCNYVNLCTWIFKIERFTGHSYDDWLREAWGSRGTMPWRRNYHGDWPWFDRDSLLKSGRSFLSTLSNVIQYIYTDNAIQYSPILCKLQIAHT